MRKGGENWWFGNPKESDGKPSLVLSRKHWVLPCSAMVPVLWKRAGVAKSHASTSIQERILLAVPNHNICQDRGTGTTRIFPSCIPIHSTDWRLQIMSPLTVMFEVMKGVEITHWMFLDMVHCHAFSQTVWCRPNNPPKPRRAGQCFNATLEVHSFVIRTLVAGLCGARSRMH